MYRVTAAFPSIPVTGKSTIAAILLFMYRINFLVLGVSLIETIQTQTTFHIRFYVDCPAALSA
jgi:hypothetical protein